MLFACTQGYFASKNCMRELRSSVQNGKPILALMEPELTHGGLTASEIEGQLTEGIRDANGWHSTAENYEKWGFKGGPTPEELLRALFAQPVVEWNRIGVFQDITMRLIAEATLPGAARGTTRLAGEVASGALVELPPPRLRRTHHVYCSPHNFGAFELMEEVRASQRLKRLAVSAQYAELPKCECMLVYLTSQTWTSGAESDLFAAQVSRAMALRLPVLLAHEMAGAGGQEARFGCEFATFFACDEGATPASLLKAGIYAQIAVALKGGEWRTASMVSSPPHMSTTPALVAVYAAAARSLSLCRLHRGSRAVVVGLRSHPLSSHAAGDAGASARQGAT
jgi:hypothetical protein